MIAIIISRCQVKNNILGSRLRELRIEKKLLIKNVAKELGVSPMAYNHYELGDREPPLDVLVSLCEYFNVSADYLLGRVDY